MRMFHATDYEIAGLQSSSDICLALCEDDARPYAPEGRMYAVDVDDSITLASESDIRAAAEQFSWYDSAYWIFELVDELEVREALANQGFSGCRYGDMGPDNAYEHDTVRVWDSSTLSLLDK